MLQTWLPVAQVMDCSRASTSFSLTFGGLVKGPRIFPGGRMATAPLPESSGDTRVGPGSTCALKLLSPDRTAGPAPGTQEESWWQPRCCGLDGGPHRAPR